ncbi:MAG: Agmatine deiminase [Actinomycetia bacterium]|nr:Agmatine deiminase [Actinomycetes bacterium]
MTRRMPAETDRHERTLMAWPTGVRRDSLWGERLENARDDYASIATTIARFEPVLLVADPSEADDARARVGAHVDVVPMPIDDSWLRDSGPIFVHTDTGERRAVHFEFNSWGQKYTPFDRDATIGTRVADFLGVHCDEAHFVLEGGSIAVDGAGTLVTTERCLLNENRNPDLSRADIEAGLREYLGVEQIVWLADGIAEDDGTDGHVDNVVAFFGPRSVLLQRSDDSSNPNHEIATNNRARLDAAGIDVVDVPHLAYVDGVAGGAPVPYVNLYACNGAVMVPTTGAPEDDEMLRIVAACYPGREVVAVPGGNLAHGGGGVHCITQQVPAP